MKLRNFFKRPAPAIWLGAGNVGIFLDSAALVLADIQGEHAVGSYAGSLDRWPGSEVLARLEFASPEAAEVLGQQAMTLAKRMRFGPPGVSRMPENYCG